jgi:hypothetical protein
MQLNETQPEPLTALLQLNFRYQLQTVLVPPDAHLSCYSSVATTFYPTLIFGLWDRGKSKKPLLVSRFKFKPEPPNDEAEVFAVYYNIQ